MILALSTGLHQGAAALGFSGRLLGRGIARAYSMSPSHTEEEVVAVNGCRARSHRLRVPLNHAEPNGESISIFVREVSRRYILTFLRCSCKNK